MKKVLITGAHSYVGTSFEQYASAHYAKEFSIDTINMRDEEWRYKDFGKYDVVFHVAGIAHSDIGHASQETKEKYYAINMNLAIETAKKAKNDGVGQFVFMSSAIIYGDSAPYGYKKVITRDTKPEPANFYGDSKWKADQGVRQLAEKDFIVTVIRAPMIYGKNSKGNYPILAKMAKKLPVFPDVQNERSMLYIENLCEFLSQVIIRGEGGIFWPQNAEYTRTSEMVKLIGDVNGHKIYVSKIWNWVVDITSRLPGKISGLTNKAFGNMSYDQSLSKCGFEYRVADLQESIERTER